MSTYIQFGLILALALSNLFPAAPKTESKAIIPLKTQSSGPDLHRQNVLSNEELSTSHTLQDPYPPPPGGLLIPPPLPLSEPAAITPTLDASPILTDTLAVYPAQFYPGEALWLTWNLAPEKAASLFADSETFLSISLPEGASLAGQPAKAQFGDDGRLLLPPDPSGELALLVSPTAAVALEFSLAWSDGKNTLAELRLAVPEAGLSLVGPQGGAASGLGGRVQVTFPPQAAGETMQVRLRRPLDWAALPPSPSGQPFEITALGQDSQSEYRKFDPPLTIEVAYDPAELRGGSEDFLHLVYYDETARDWLPVPSQVDPQAGLVRGFSDHLSVFDVSTSGWEASRLPGMQAFQTSQYTGAAAYSFPLWTPPGPGGLQPSLELSYNSQAVDNSIAGLSQAAWVGMGWSLDTGAIERNQNGTPDYTADDTFSISAGGLNSLLLPGADGYYHTSDESFWRIQYDSPTGSWIAQDGQGSTYIFGDTPETKAQYPSGYHYSCNGNYTTNATTWRWSLHSLVNASGKALTYSYFTDYQVKSHPCDSGLTFNTAIAVYPAAIDYPHGQYRVVFNREGRLDYKSSWTNPAALNFYQKYRLQSVEVVRQTTVVKKYIFNYNAAALIYPSQTWTAGGSTTSLVSLQELGRGGAPLPLNSFYYVDSLHLTRAENGYGGAVEFVYESEPWYELDTPEGKKYKVTSECIKEHGSWGPNGVTGFNGGRAWCENQNGNYHLYVRGQVMMSVPAELLQPGAEYKGSAQIMRSTSDPLQVEIGLKTSATSYLVANTATFTSAGYHDISGFAKAPATSEQTSLYLYCDRDCRVSDPAVRLQPTRYRVVEKKLYDGLDPNPQIFTYRYDEAATNDAAHSAAAGSSDPYFDEFSEFRGHALAQEIGPDGRVTSTYFHQDDARKGRASVTLVSQESFAEAFSSSGLDANNWAISSSPTWSLPRLAGDAALQIASPDAVWRGVYRGSESITDGKGVLLQFKVSSTVSGQNVGSGYFLDHDPYGSANFWRWGVLVTASGQLEARFVEAGGASQPGAVLFGPNDFKRDAWYVVFLIVDDQKFHAAAWERDDPEHYASFDHTPGTSSVGLAWRFNNYVSNGTSVLDAYSEGNFYQRSDSLYEEVNVPTGSLPVQQMVPHDPYTGLTITWVKTTSEQSTTFGGDGEWVGSRSTYEYDGYGNRTRSLAAEYDRAQNDWRAYRLSRTPFFPNAGSPYLVSLPAASALYACPADSFGVTCSSAYPTSLPNSLLVSARQFLYDGASSNTQPPGAGRLTGERTLLRWGDPGNYADPRYQDADYTLDEWGNRTLATIYNSEGTATVRAGSNPDPQARSTAYEYDGTYNTFLVKETNPLLQAVNLGYDYDFGLPNSQTDANGVLTTAAYDAFGRMVKVVRLPDTDSFPTFTATYHDDWQPFGVELVQRLNQGTEDISKQVRFYDGLGRAVQSQTVGAVITTGTVAILVDSTYDAYGRLTKQSVPYALDPSIGIGGQWQVRDESQPGSVTTYDLLGRPLSQAAPGTSPTIYTYSDGYHQAAGYGYSLVCVTNPRGNQTCQISDLFGRTRESDPPAGPGVVYTYDQADRLTQAIYGSAVTTLTYDLAGRKTQMIDADMGTWYYAYDPLGSLVRQTDAKGQRICLYYDALNRLTGKHYRTDDACPASPSMNASYSYDAGTFGQGRRTGMLDLSGGTTWTYDQRGRLTEESKIITGSGTFLTQWSYNSADLPVTMTYPDNELLSYTYHPQMAMNTLMSNRDQNNQANNFYLVQQSVYDAAGRIDLRGLGATAQAPTPTMVNDYTYNIWNVQGGRLQRLNAGTYASQASLLDLSYNYDPVGNIQDILDVKNSSQKQCFGYDALDRLVSARVGDSACNGSLGNGEYADETYAYNSTTGNLSSKTGMGTYTYDATHKHAVATTSAGWAYDYDFNGNMIRRDPPGSNYFDLAYDAENRLVEVKKNGAVIAAFTFDGDGARVKTVMGSTTTVFAGAHYELSGSTVTKYYNAGGSRVAMRQGGTLYWLLSDQLGSTSKVATATGSLHSQQLYKPWGVGRYSTGTLPTKYLFTGQYSYAGGGSNDFGLYFYNARWYDPALGRWSQPDSMVPETAQGVQAWDRYAYVNNSPVNFRDPSGHCLVLCTALIGGAIGGIVGAVGYTAYTLGTGREFNTGHLLLSAAGGAAAGALIGTGVGFAAGMSSAAATSAAITGAGAASAATSTLLTTTGGDPTDEIGAASQAFGNLSQAANYGVQPGNQLRNALSGTGLEVHHIIEQRLAPALGQTAAQARQWLSVAVTPEEHQVFTNYWRNTIGYINSNNPVNTATTTLNNIQNATQELYAKYPAVLDAARKIISGAIE